MWFLALRQLLSRKKQSLIILLGIAIGAAVFIFISSTQLGFRRYMISELIDNGGHIKVSAQDELLDEAWVNREFPVDLLRAWVTPPSGVRGNKVIQNPADWYAVLKNYPRVRSWSGILERPSLIRVGNQSQQLNLIGVDPLKHVATTRFDQKLQSGKLQYLLPDSPTIILGSVLMERLGLKLGDLVQVAGQNGNWIPFRVVGVFSTGARGQDKTIAYAHIGQVGRLFESTGQVSSLIIRLQGEAEAKQWAGRLRQFFSDKVESWDEANAQFLEMTKTQDVTRYLITGGMILVVAFSIYNILSIIVNQKRREIAIFKAMGYSNPQILKLFLYQGLSLGLIGAFLGCVLGAFVSVFFIDKLKTLWKLRLDIPLDPWVFMQSFLLVTGSSVLASLLPAWTAARMNPVNIIKEEG